MVFSSVSSFLDPPNWSQQSNHQQQSRGSVITTTAAHAILSHQHLPPLPPPNPNPSQHHHVGSGSGGPARFAGGSMVERARIAKINPQPEGALRCPRCDSTNTKFCYFNNYSLSQPRHFCKACRRYWTRGGALRNVPVGGGCRRTKKGKNGNIKSSSSSSSSATQEKQTATIGQLQQQHTNSHHFPFLPSLQNLAQLGGIGLNLSAINSNNQAQIALSNGGTSLMSDLGFLSASGLMNSNNNNNNNENVTTPVGTAPQFAFFDPATGIYSFQTEGNIGNNIGLSSSMTAARVSQMAPVKIEEPHLLNLSRPPSGLTSPANNNNPYWPVSDFLGSSSDNRIL